MLAAQLTSKPPRQQQVPARQVAEHQHCGTDFEARHQSKIVKLPGWIDLNLQQRCCDSCALTRSALLYALLQETASGPGGADMARCPGHWAPFLTTAPVEYITLGIRSPAGKRRFENHQP